MAFNAGRIIMIPRNSGTSIDDYTFEDVRKFSKNLSQQEAKDSHAKYYMQKIEISKELQEAIDAPPMDPTKAFMPHEFGKYMNNSGYCEVETGYCILPNGVAYASALLRQEGITDDMIKFFNENFCKTDDLFYKTWFPGAHTKLYRDGCVEDFGWGDLNMRWGSDVPWENCGMSSETIQKNDPACFCAKLVNSTARRILENGFGKLEYNMLAKYHRDTEYGREMRIRLWYGINFENGEYKYSVPEGGYSVNVARCCMSHVIHETSNDTRLIKNFWNEYHDVKM